MTSDVQKEFKIKRNGQTLRVRLMGSGETITAKSLTCHKECLAYDPVKNWNEQPVVNYARTAFRPSYEVGKLVGDFPSWVYVQVESAFYRGESFSSY
jgi:hypothetical protein